MTEYGRGHGSEPWHPEDPLYGEQDGYGRQQPASGSNASGAGYPSSSQWDTGQWDAAQTGQWDTGQYAAGPDATGQWNTGDTGQWNTGDTGQWNTGQWNTGDTGQWDTGQWDTGQWNTQPDPYAGAQQPHPQQPHGWDAAHGGPAGHAPGQDGPYGPEHTDPYGMPYDRPQQPHPGQPHPPQHRGPMAGGAPGGPGPYEPQPEGPYATQEMPQYGPGGPRPGAPAPDDWDDAPEEPEHAFFRDDDDDDDHGRGRRLRGGRDDGEPPKRRKGLVLVMAVALVVGGGYAGYQVYESRFAAAPDYAGEGTGTVQVEIPADTSLAGMGRILKSEGVVKSVDAFVEAADTPEGRGIQSGIYTLHRKMSAEAAVAMMTDPAALNSLIVREGMRATQVYAAVDEKLGVKAGTTKKVAKSQAGKLGLPSWAKNRKAIDPLEGFLFPSRYDAAEGSKPEDVLRQMVERATQQYEKQGVERQARKLGLESPLQLVTVASLVQAEGMTHDDFRKMARVVYNRLKAGNTETNGKLEFDSTYNYLKGQSKIDLNPTELRNFDHPYNTYFYKGLPPGPIGNPGDEAVNAAIHPERGTWYYFVSIKGKTKFATTYADHQKLVREFNKSRRDG